MLETFWDRSPGVLLKYRSRVPGVGVLELESCLESESWSRDQSPGVGALLGVEAQDLARFRVSGPGSWSRSPGVGVPLGVGALESEPISRIRSSPGVGVLESESKFRVGARLESESWNRS